MKGMFFKLAQRRGDAEEEEVGVGFGVSFYWILCGFGALPR